jgi:hypothetical protein
MAVDSSNILRVELKDIFDAVEMETAHKSEALDEGATVDVMAVVQDDRQDIVPFILLACAEIADHSNYIQDENQNGLDALTRDSNGDYDGTDLSCVDEKQKLIGESLDSNTRDLLVFSISELENFNPNKYTIVQEYIKESIIRFTLHKWYHMKNQRSLSIQEYELYERSLDKVKNNSITNKKRKSVRRKHFYF